MRIRLEGAPPLRLKLHLDAVEVSGGYVLLEAMNIRSIGPNLELAGEADPSDGLLDVVLISEDEKQKLAEYLTARIAGQAAPARFSSRRVRRMRIESDDEVRVRIDDDVWPKHGEHPPFAPMVIDVAMHSEKLEILAPT
jgi:diacylglycerol kinase (ATP)